jgi:hypothetical protein
MHISNFMSSYASSFFCSRLSLPHKQEPISQPFRHAANRGPVDGMHPLVLFARGSHAVAYSLVRCLSALLALRGKAAIVAPPPRAEKPLPKTPPQIEAAIRFPEGEVAALVAHFDERAKNCATGSTAGNGDPSHWASHYSTELRDNLRQLVRGRIDRRIDARHLTEGQKDDIVSQVLSRHNVDPEALEQRFAALLQKKEART